MNDRSPHVVLFHHSFPDDLKEIPRNLVDRIVRACETRLGSNPERYGERLRQSLRGFWKLRVGNYRGVYEIVGHEVRVYGARHRKNVYEKMMTRLSRGWRSVPGL